MAKITRDDVSELIAGRYRELLDRARRYLRSDEDAEDVVQDVVLSLMEAPHLLAGVERVSGWLFTLVYRRCVDVIRRSSRRSEKEQDDLTAELFESPFELPDGLGDELARAVAEILETLPEEQRDAFVLNSLDGLTFAEISEQTGTPMGTLMARKKRAVDRMRVELAQRGFGPDHT